MSEPVLPVDAAPKTLPRHCPHCGGDIDEDRTVMWGGWVFDEERRQFSPGTPGSGIHFTQAEAAIIGAILRGLGKTVKKEGTLYSALCRNRPDSEWPEMKNIDVTICKIRRKMEEHNLMMFDTIWGVGFAAVPYQPDPKFFYKHEYHRIEFISKERAARGVNHTRANVCSCGHISSHHRHSGSSRTITGCIVKDCTCIKFQQRKTK